MSLADDLVREAAKAIAAVDDPICQSTQWAEYRTEARAAVAAVLDTLAENGVYRDLSDPAMDFEALAETVREGA